MPHPMMPLCNHFVQNTFVSQDTEIRAALPTRVCTRDLCKELIAPERKGWRRDYKHNEDVCKEGCTTSTQQGGVITEQGHILSVELQDMTQLVYMESILWTP